MKIIAVSGGSGSGKSLIADLLFDRVGADNCLVLREDDYFKPLPEGETGDGFNFDHIDARDRDLLYDDLLRLKAGETIQKPSYDFATHSRLKETTAIAPKPVLVIEGVHVCYESRFRDLYDCKVYVDTSDDIRLARRMIRDIKERGRDPDSVVQQYLTTVKPMHYRYTFPSKFFSDVIINNEFSRSLNPSRIPRYIDMILDRIGYEG